MSYLRPAKKANSRSRFTPSQYPSDLGGFTFPKWTGRPHMGPFNRVMDRPSPFRGDEKYRQHDIGYGKLTNPYLNFNKFDENLLRSPTEGYSDYVGKGAFFAKKVLDLYNVPSLYEGGYASPKKDVNAKTYYNADFVPFREKMPYSPPDIYVPPPSASVRPSSDRAPSSSVSRARGGSGGGRKHDYIELYDFST